LRHAEDGRDPNTAGQNPETRRSGQSRRTRDSSCDGAGTDAHVKVYVPILLALLVPAVAAGSTGIDTVGGPCALRVDARGYAEASWAGHTIAIPPTRRVLPGKRLSARDVGRPTRAPIAFAKVVRQTPDGRLWALQSWAVLPGRAAELGSRAGAGCRPSCFSVCVQSARGL
jgi:hypothetical protein